MSPASPTAKPSRAPAMERDFEKVRTTIRFGYLLTSGSALVPPKAT